VELFLNIVWLSVSILMVILCVYSIRHGHTKLSWSAAVALFVLLVLLFPVISMTDDLQAMTAPAEVEHLMRRHHDAPMLHMGSNMLEAVALLSLILIGIALPALCSIRVRTHGYVAALLAGFVRAYGVRPPPAVAWLTA
jgi:cytochrome b